MTDTTTPETNIHFLRFVYTLCYVFFRFYFRLKVQKDQQTLNELMVQERPLIVIFNHASYLDVPAIGIGLGLKLMRRMTLPGKKELFEEGSGLRWMKPLISVIPVDRDMTDTSAVRGLLRALQHGHNILMAPEGTRSPDGTVRPFHSGFAKLAYKANALVVPIGIQGAAQALPKGKLVPRPKQVVVSIGAPLDPQAYWHSKPNPSDFETFMEAARQAVVDLSGQPKG